MANGRAKKSLAPTAKVGVAGLAGALTTVILAATGIEASAELSAAITTLIAFVAGYLTPER
jgi:hypothetical protein